MRRYAKLSTFDLTHFQEILRFFFDRCDKVNIYFPNSELVSEEINTFKTKFLAVTHIIEESKELNTLEEALEEKEGFSMVIASNLHSLAHFPQPIQAALHAFIATGPLSLFTQLTYTRRFFTPFLRNSMI